MPDDGIRGSSAADILYIRQRLGFNSIQQPDSKVNFWGEKMITSGNKFQSHVEQLGGTLGKPNLDKKDYEKLKETTHIPRADFQQRKKIGLDFARPPHIA